jgi:hypothetical protein
MVKKKILAGRGTSFRRHLMCLRLKDTRITVPRISIIIPGIYYSSPSFSSSTLLCFCRARRHAVIVCWIFSNCQKLPFTSYLKAVCWPHPNRTNMAEYTKANGFASNLFLFQFPTIMHFVRKIISVWQIIPDVLFPSAHVRKATNGTHPSAWIVKVGLYLQPKCQRNCSREMLSFIAALRNTAGSRQG